MATKTRQVCLWPLVFACFVEQPAWMNSEIIQWQALKIRRFYHVSTSMPSAIDATEPSSLVTGTRILNVRTG